MLQTATPTMKGAPSPPLTAQPTTPRPPFAHIASTASATLASLTSSSFGALKSAPSPSSRAHAHAHTPTPSNGTTFRPIVTYPPMSARPAWQILKLAPVTPTTPTTITTTPTPTNPTNPTTPVRTLAAPTTPLVSNNHSQSSSSSSSNSNSNSNSSSSNNSGSSGGFRTVEASPPPPLTAPSPPCGPTMRHSPPCLPSSPLTSLADPPTHTTDHVSPLSTATTDAVSPSTGAVSRDAAPQWTDALVPELLGPPAPPPPPTPPDPVQPKVDPPLLTAQSTEKIEDAMTTIANAATNAATTGASHTAAIANASTNAKMEEEEKGGAKDAPRAPRAPVSGPKRKSAEATAEMVSVDTSERPSKYRKSSSGVAEAVKPSGERKKRREFTEAERHAGIDFAISRGFTDRHDFTIRFENSDATSAYCTANALDYRSFCAWMDYEFIKWQKDPTKYVGVHRERARRLKSESKKSDTDASKQNSSSSSSSGGGGGAETSDDDEQVGGADTADTAVDDASLLVFDAEDMRRIEEFARSVGGKPRKSNRKLTRAFVDKNNYDYQSVCLVILRNYKHWTAKNPTQPSTQPSDPVAETVLGTVAAAPKTASQHIAPVPPADDGKQTSAPSAPSATRRSQRLSTDENQKTWSTDDDIERYLHWHKPQLIKGQLSVKTMMVKLRIGYNRLKDAMARLKIKYWLDRNGASSDEDDESDDPQEAAAKAKPVAAKAKPGPSTPPQVDASSSSSSSTSAPFTSPPPTSSSSSSSSSSVGDGEGEGDEDPVLQALLTTLSAETRVLESKRIAVSQLESETGEMEKQRKQLEDSNARKQARLSKLTDAVKRLNDVRNRRAEEEAQLRQKEQAAKDRRAALLQSVKEQKQRDVAIQADIEKAIRSATPLNA